MVSGAAGALQSAWMATNRTVMSELLVGSLLFVAVVLITRRSNKAQRLEPTGAGDLPPIPDPEPVAGYDDDEEFAPLEGEEMPSEDDYDDRLPCNSEEEALSVAILGEDAAGCLLPNAVEQRKNTDVPDAPVPANAPTWPVRVNRQKDVRVSYQDVRGKWHGRWGRHFGAGRKKKDGSGGRHHAGIDLAGDTGDTVVAARAGVVEAILPFTRGTWAVYVRSPDGTLINYGEVEKGSWRQYDVSVGTELEPGDPIAVVGAQSEGGAHMLHFEFYDASATIEEIRAGGMQWPLEQPAPPALRDPTKFLLAAQDKWIVEHPEIV
jgi:murein DD-endopeptidase MepM/ murein hydrolase activator NlpD